jgi:hypothetical protein
MAQASHRHPWAPQSVKGDTLRKESKTRSTFRLLAGAPFILNLFIATVFLSLAGPQLPAQSAPQQVLHRRVDAQAVEERDFFTISRGRTTLPIEVSGAYSLGETGEAVEIDLQPDRLSGYISRFGDEMSDEGTPLTFFFDTSWLNGRQIGFATRRVHDTWFSFRGTIVRGNAQTRSQDGYYRLQGSLVMHNAANGASQARDVSLPLMREYSGR